MVYTTALAKNAALWCLLRRLIYPTQISIDTGKEQYSLPGNHELLANMNRQKDYKLLTRLDECRDHEPLAIVSKWSDHELLAEVNE